MREESNPIEILRTLISCKSVTPEDDRCQIMISEYLKQLGFEAIQSRFEVVDWQRKKPNLITMNQVIEHLDDPASAIEKAYDMLAPGGYIFIETPSVKSWDFYLFLMMPQ